MNHRNVLILHPTGGWGGAERTTCNIAKALSCGGISTAVLTNENRFRTELGGSIHVEIASFNPWFDGGWKAIFSDLKKFIQAIKCFKPRVVVGMMPYAAFLASVARRFSPCSFIHVASPRGSCLNYLKNFLPSRGDRLRYRIFF
ncbi:MAG: glycosyltransferase [Thermodesulforhabdaceae bacterium]